jgi:periplasmic protein TonB
MFAFHGHINNLTMKAQQNKHAIFAIPAAMCILLACNNSNDYKSDKDSLQKQSAVIEQSSIDTNVITTVGPARDTTDAAASNTVGIATKSALAKKNPAKKGHKGVTRIAIYNPTYTAKMEEDKNGIYNYAEIKPMFPGGEAELAKFIQSNIQYPQSAIDDGVEATVVVTFAVNEKGKVFSPKLKDEKVGYGLDEEALAAVRKMPRWTPGRVKGKNVKTYYNLPITFTLAD